MNEENQKTILSLSEDELYSIFEFGTFHDWILYSTVNHLWFKLLNDKRVVKN